MYQKILLAYNGSSHSAAALRQAAQLAKLTDAELHMLGIVVTTGGLALAQASGPIDVLEVERQRIETALKTAAETLIERGIKVKCCIRTGDPALEIIEHAHKIETDLTVLGHTDKGVLARWFQGSVGAKLLSHLPSSLLIVTN